MWVNKARRGINLLWLSGEGPLPQKGERQEHKLVSHCTRHLCFLQIPPHGYWQIRVICNSKLFYAIVAVLSEVEGLIWGPEITWWLKLCGSVLICHMTYSICIFLKIWWTRMKRPCGTSAPPCHNKFQSELEWLSHVLTNIAASNVAISCQVNCPTILLVDVWKKMASANLPEGLGKGWGAP